MSDSKVLHGSWTQHGDRGRGTFEDNGYGDTNEDRKTGVELPEGYSELNVDSTVNTQEFHSGGGNPGSEYSKIPEQK